MSECSRRKFSTRLAASLTAGLVAPSVVAQEIPAAPAEPADPEPRMSQEDHQLALLRDRYPTTHLTPEILEGVRAGLANNRRLAERIRQTELRWEIEPAFVFRVWRES